MFTNTAKFELGLKMSCFHLNDTGSRRHCYLHIQMSVFFRLSTYTGDSGERRNESMLDNSRGCLIRVISEQRATVSHTQPSAWPHPHGTKGVTILNHKKSPLNHAVPPSDDGICNWTHQCFQRQEGSKRVQLSNIAGSSRLTRHKWHLGFRKQVIFLFIKRIH